MKVYFRIINNRVDIISQGKRIGHIGWGVNSEISRGWPVGYSINPEFRQRGIMRKALKALIDHTDEPILQAVVLQTNIASQRTLLSAGFTCIRNVPDEHQVFEYKRGA